MNPEDPTIHVLYILGAAIAGAVTALAFMPWQKMSWQEITLTLFVGSSFAIFVTPWIANLLPWLRGVRSVDMAGLTYVSASGSNTLLPMLIRKLGGTISEKRV